MNSEEAKFILQAYRHREEDEGDPQMARALAQARRDPELVQWLAEEARWHRSISDRLKSIPVPARLKSQILAGGKIVKSPAWWRRPLNFAAAAALVLLCALAAINLVDHQSRDFSEFRREMSDFLTADLTYLDNESKSVDELQRYLARHDSPTDFQLPEKVRELVSIGCRVLNWHGRKVSLICFHAGRGQEVHLFIMDDADWADLPAADAPVMAASGFWMTAGWRDGGKAFLLAGKGDEAALRQLF